MRAFCREDTSAVASEFCFANIYLDSVVHRNENFDVIDSVIAHQLFSRDLLGQGRMD